MGRQTLSERKCASVLQCHGWSTGTNARNKIKLTEHALITCSDAVMAHSASTGRDFLTEASEKQGSNNCTIATAVMIIQINCWKMLQTDSRKRCLCLDSSSCELKIPGKLEMNPQSWSQNVYVLGNSFCR